MEPCASPRRTGSRAARLALLTILQLVGAGGCDGEGDPAQEGPAITEDIPFEKDADPPVCQDDELTAIIDVHEHAMGPGGVGALVDVLPLAGVDRSIVFAMPENGYPDSVTIIQAAEENGGVLIPFTTVDVRDPYALPFLETSVNAGAAGLKLFSGHGEVHGDTPLDDPMAEPIYDYLEQTGTPLLMHVNGPFYLDELERVLDAHPDLVMICPHFCLFSAMPGRLARLLDEHPNLSIDVSFGSIAAEQIGFGNISNNIEVWKRFVRVYVDRITFGTDRVLTSGATQDNDLTHFAAYIGMIREPTFEFMGIEYQGLAADACTEKHILQHNAERFVDGAPPQRLP